MHPGFLAVLVALGIINSITFTLFGIDKVKSSIQGARRISEKTLLLLALFGGSPGALIAMSLFRHKTKKGSFQGFIIGIVALQTTAIVFFLHQYFS